MSNRIINVLPPSIYNKISAGEVVENPASALKEILENSVDAGARRISIEVSNGGFDLISVTDNGSGIYEDDLDALFVKHATSKLSSAEELYSVQTLGFRGEALSSISSVARVTLTTRHALSDTGIEVTAEEGKIISKKYVSCNVGTKVEVRDLFYNTPARKKFMKAAAREAIDVSKYVSRFILTNPNLQVTYRLNDEVVYRSKGEGLAEAIFAVYGADWLSKCLPISYQAELLNVSGYVGNPMFTKPNSTYQTLSVNGRYVVDRGIQESVTQAFRPYLMTRQYPFFVIDVSLPFDKVDVNVHPRKTEVRFMEPQYVRGKVYRAVQAALKEFNDKFVTDTLRPSVLDEEEDTVPKDYKVSTFFKDVSDMTSEQVKDVLEIQKQTNLQSKMPFSEFAKQMEKTLTVQSARKAYGLPDESVAQAEMTYEIPYITPPPQEQPPEKDIADELAERARILGSAFKTYLIVEIDDKVIFIDQHAAHERMLYEKLMAQRDFSMQPLIVPYVFTVSEAEADFIQRNAENILQSGLEIEPFGINTFRIRAVSTLLTDLSMEQFVTYLLSEADKSDLDSRTLIKEKIASMACKAAVKAGNALSDYDIKYILKSMYENKILQCPHGRPVTVVFTKAQLEKMFKRTV